MRPTFSIILFTVLSGAGYGLWFLAGLGLAVHWPSCAMSPGQACAHAHVIDYALGLGLVLVTAGLLSSLGHLGQPQRAWRALSQWRSSWLSREGVAALLAYLPAIVIALLSFTAWRQASPSPDENPLLRWSGIALALCSLLTVYCTANIYASLKPIAAWRSAYVTPGYLLLALYSGLLLFCALATLPYATADNWSDRDMNTQLAALLVAAVACAAIKLGYWRAIDRAPRGDAGRATGLDAQGTVRSFEQPHTEENYLTREMGFVLARKHASKLRAIALSCGFALPALLAVLALAMPAMRIVAAWIALASGVFGILVERWLFFAQARHAVIGYYGR